MAVPGSRSALPRRSFLSDSSSRVSCFNCGNPGHSAHDCTLTQALGKRVRAKQTPGDSSSKASRFKPPPPPAAPPPKAEGSTLLPSEESDNSPKRLFVGNLSMDVTEGDILKIFTKFGTVSSCAWLHHFGGPRRGQPKGFCFVEMKTRAQSQAALDALNGRRLRGRELRINFARDESAQLVSDVPEAGTVRKAGMLEPRPASEATLELRASMVKQTLLDMGVSLPPPKPDLPKQQQAPTDVGSTPPQQPDVRMKQTENGSTQLEAISPTEPRPSPGPPPAPPNQTSTPNGSLPSVQLPPRPPPHPPPAPPLPQQTAVFDDSYQQVGGSVSAPPLPPHPPPAPPPLHPPPAPPHLQKTPMLGESYPGPPPQQPTWNISNAVLPPRPPPGPPPQQQGQHQQDHHS